MSKAEETTTTSEDVWSPSSLKDVVAARSLQIWPLDDANANMLNEVHHKNYINPIPKDEYDIVVIGAGAGGLVSSRQSARRGASSAMISAHLAGGDCLTVGCVPSKSLLRCMRMIKEIKRATKPNNEFGIKLLNNSKKDNDDDDNDDIVHIDFEQIMKRMRMKRAQIAPVDGHARGIAFGVDVFQGFGRFISPNEIEVISSSSSPPPPVESIKTTTTPTTTTTLKFKKAVIATGGRPSIPDNIPGLKNAPFITNETLFNLQRLPSRMIILGSGVVALEMAQAFSSFGSDVTVLMRSKTLFPNSDPMAGPILRHIMEEEDGVTFLEETIIKQVEVLREGDEDDGSLPLMKVTLNVKSQQQQQETAEETTTETTTKEMILECEALLVATGRAPNVENIGLEHANVPYDAKTGVLIDDYAKSINNSNIYALGDCASGVPRLTHVSGEMAKVVVQNALFDNDGWAVSSLVVPAVMYTEPEFATVGIVRSPTSSSSSTASTTQKNNDNNNDDDEEEGMLDEYIASLEHNDRAILDGDNNNGSYIKILCQKGTDIIVGCSIVAPRAGELINEVTLAMKHKIGLEAIGRNIHSYPTTGESLMACGIQYINSKWKTL